MAIYDDSPDSVHRQSEYDTRTSSYEPEQSKRAGLGSQNDRSSPPTVYNPYYTGRPRTPASANRQACINRFELIKRIKSAGSRPSSPEIERPASANDRNTMRSPTPLANSGFLHQRPQTPERPDDRQSTGLGIERPRSALHSGDFREKETSGIGFSTFGDAPVDESVPILSTSPVVPWHPDFPGVVFRQARLERQRPPSPPGVPIQRPIRSRATSIANNFTYKPPTSPLAQSLRPDTPDTPEPTGRPRSRSPDKSRRQTYSPRAMQHFPSDLAYHAYEARHSPTLRPERTLLYQAHQPRRSVHSLASLAPTPLRPANLRRPSLTDSPLHHAPMVGSYEESILRGRMSTTPSKPLNFVAQIGVLGKGDCKPSLKCPPHASVPFPAVFYSYSTGASNTSDQPSPYVGLVDLENNLPKAKPASDKRRQRLQTSLNNEGSRASSQTRDESSASEAQNRRRHRHKQKRRSGSPKAPPGGSYRIPQQGQLQIIIKNPNKTAVKLFLVPYDLSDMEPGQKTFIRQRSYSAGPIIDMPLTSRKNLGTDRPEASLNATDDPHEKPTLRYLIHLHICCPAKGRYFLYKSVRVVFANRVPDGKEKLRNEIQMPEPRYSVYRPGRESNMGTLATATPQDDGRRRSHVERLPNTDSVWPSPTQFYTQSLPSVDLDPLARFSLPISPLPRHGRIAMSRLESRPASRQLSDGMMDIDSEDNPSQETQSSRSTLSSPQSRYENGSRDVFVRLDDPFRFVREVSRERGQTGIGRNESLLSRRLKDLAMQNRDQGLDETS
ncbi:Hypothetical protein R9X50_00007200 [Acrodontium crateriforme]|uniref:Atos-like conserved domain-containing protein n=1 Tax=Acrodontium crateriforme TaxID=150365 RepID=A0AAQ3R4M7_9PEZI|nr:Hypothetical protein R9X50_00007200 [Acrodontium crateriforme]